MVALIPLPDASRRPVRFPIVTVCIIVANVGVFALELAGGDAFVLKWAAIPAHITPRLGDRVHGHVPAWQLVTHSR
jgi:membrane associated rhomboid family serine protease